MSITRKLSKYCTYPRQNRCKARDSEYILKSYYMIWITRAQLCHESMVYDASMRSPLELQPKRRAPWLPPGGVFPTVALRRGAPLEKRSRARHPCSAPESPREFRTMTPQHRLSVSTVFCDTWLKRG